MRLPASALYIDLILLSSVTYSGETVSQNVSRIQKGSNPKYPFPEVLLPRVSGPSRKYWEVSKPRAKKPQEVSKVSNSIKDLSPKLLESKNNRTKIGKTAEGNQNAVKTQAESKNLQPKPLTIKEEPTPPDFLRMEGTPKELKVKTIKMMEQFMYMTKEYAMKKVDNVSRRYANDITYRLAFIFLKLDQIQFEMHSMYTYLQKNYVQYNHGYSRYVPLIRVYDHLIYYTHFVRKNVDVTYAVEYLLELLEDTKSKVPEAILEFLNKKKD